MSTASAGAHVGLRGDRGATDSAHQLANDAFTTAAWLCAVPCAVVTIAAIVLLGPLLGDVIAGDPSAYTPLPDWVTYFKPEPTEHARYLLAICGPLLFVAALASAPRWLPRVPARVAQVGVPATQVLLVAALATCLAVQHSATFVTATGVTETARYFTLPTYVAAALLAAAIVATIRIAGLREPAAALLRESRGRRIAATSAAIAMTVVWLLHAVQTDTSIGMAALEIRFHMAFTIDEAFAVLNGLTPLVDFTTQYGALASYLAAAAMAVFGKSLLTYSLAMTALSGLALLAIFGVLRRAARSAVAALLLYLPFLATGFFMFAGDSVNRATVGGYFSTFPSRIAGPYLLAWLTARWFDRDERPLRALWLLFLAGGLVVVNNQDFGLAALGATVAALLWGAADLSRATLKRLVIGLAGGVVTAFALFAAFTLARSGELPQVDRALDYAGLFGVGGYGMRPIPDLIGLHLVIYATYVAAIAVATVRALQGAPERVLTGMLAWSGIFGLGSASYFIGRSHADTLVWMFSDWALALALLTIVVVRGLMTDPSRRPTLPALAVLFGLGIAACSLAQTPAPWTQVERLTASFAPSEEVPLTDSLVPPSDAATRTFVTSLADGRSRFVVRDGAPVAILFTNGHRVADAYGVVNVSPYTGTYSLLTIERVDAVIDALRAAGGNTVVVPSPTFPGIVERLRQRGFELVTDEGVRPYVAGETRATALPWPDGRSVVKFVDGHNLHPPALQTP